jgi:Macrocin-O-methyltransferase (TylF)/Methyltransferase domain
VFPLWDSIIAPVLEAAGARRVVEIGAFQGETTVKLLDQLGPEGELHVIDPEPHFDPTEHQRRFPGRFHFYRDLSHNVLPELPVMDAVLIDGDHNWYTVFHELELLAATARKAGAPLPVLLMHDVGWPYGRRDLYYAPERIPEEYRQPYAQRGIRRGRSELLESGGINPRMNNALHEGGPRNGVLTALEDFRRQHEHELRIIVVPIYFSLAIVAEEERLASRADLAEALDRLERPPFLRRMLTLAESMRLKEVHWAQAVFHSAQEKLDRGALRYLALLKADLPGGGHDLDSLERCLQTIREEKVAGDLVECGTRHVGASLLLCGFLEAHELRQPSVWLAGPAEPEAVRHGLERLNLPDERVHVLDGGLEAQSAPAPFTKAALIRVGIDAEPGETLAAVYDRVTVGGFVLVDGYATEERREAVDRFRAAYGAAETLQRLDSTLACWRRLR